MTTAATTDHTDALWVVCLCAQWCGVCRQWRAAFEEQAAAHPGFAFAWVDVEDDAEAMGDVDIETFPTLLVAQGDQPLFLGPVLPTGAGVARLLATLRQRPEPLAGAQAGEARELLQRLQSGVLARSRL